jgi:putative DNA primase/helicase
MGVVEQALELTFRTPPLPVFPCSPNKKPSISRGNGGKGYKDATSDEDEVRSLFRRAPNATLVGVPTGAITGFDVLDIDYRHDGGRWEIENAHRLPETRLHQTMSGGRHYLFRHAPGVRNSTSKKELAPGVDVRGDGGYIIHPPSLGYLIDSDADIAEWPPWLLELVLKRDKKEIYSTQATPQNLEIKSKRLNAYIDTIAAKLHTAPEGGKHDALRSAAIVLGGIQVEAGISDQQAISLLVNALPNTVQDYDNARETARWGLQQGRARPFTLPDRPRPTAPAPAESEIVEETEPRRAVHHASRDNQEPDTWTPPNENPRRPTIRVIPGLRHFAADQGIAALATAKIAFYQRGETMVRTATIPAKTSDGEIINIPGIIPVVIPILTRALGTSAEWERSKADGTIIRIDPPKEVVEQIAAMTGFWPFPALTGIISTPTMRPDGSILSSQGYDERTGLVLLAPPPMPPIIEKPTRLDADRAIELLNSLLSEFPFADDPSWSVALSMILTTVLRGAIGPAVPMHVATAPAPGSGKSYLADIASAISTGERCAAMAVAPNPEETEKRLVGAALAGQQIISIDNISDTLSGDFLNQVTERPILLIRPLGTSVMTRIANTFTVLANGNNLSAPADLVRRTIVCRLDANLENPEEREFNENPIQTVLSDRGKYINACLTIGRAYVEAGRPVICKPLPSFERWSGLVRSAIIWLGMPDPCESMSLARAEDPAKAARTALFTAWENEIGLHKMGQTAAELVELTENRDEHGFLHPQLREACLEVAADRTGTTVSSKRIAKWLSANNNTVSAGLKLSLNRQTQNRLMWVLRVS